jgi:GT2 family glycosyltransferase
MRRPIVRGKFLYVGDEKFWIRGTTYGTFRPDAHGNEYHSPETVERDFALMAENGLNTVRTYTVPPRWLLDTAQRYGLRVMVGLPWEQHITFLDDPERARAIEERVRLGVRACAGHPALLCYAIGNEIPASIVRWHGNQLVERYLERLYWAAKAEDPEGLVTYVNYPTTEYLQLPFLDVVCFNVYLETQERLASYLARLQNIAGDRPLIMGEIGLDSRRHGEEAQAKVLDWQVRTAFAAGCAGAFVFAWTDEWYRGGHEITDWDFGLTDRQRCPKPALTAVCSAFAEVPFPKDLSWPRISVVVCSYNGSRTIRDCFEGLLRLEYPNFEVIVVDDGSTDATAAITRQYGYRLISTENRGLSSARNTGMQAAMGEIVAYIDDDAYPDPHWLTYLAATFMATDYVGVGGPNLAPPGDGRIADCVANAPGGPVHVLLSDQEAEHIPGCNMAFRKTALQAIGGFDPQFRTAGDDVDVCWRLQQQGWMLGFSPAALVWHHRRNSIRTYWRQQQGYGKAEALLEKKWPEKYNVAGHSSWAGRLYGKGVPQMLSWYRGRIYQGTWGSALFQSIYQPAPSLFTSLPLMPEWYFVVGSLAVLAALGLLWAPLLWALPFFLLAAGVLLVQAGVNAVRASFTSVSRVGLLWLGLWGVTTLLHIMQPLARLRGRLRHGLTPWRWNPMQGVVWPWPQVSIMWHEQWQSATERLQLVETSLRTGGNTVVRGGDYDRWDLEVRGGLLGSARTLMTIEEHGAGKQLIRFRSWPKCSKKGLALIGLCAALAVGSAVDQAWPSAIILGFGVVLLASRAFQECAGALATILHALKRVKAEDV